MSKERISATVDKATLALIKRILDNGNFRNKSHVIEAAIELLEKETKNGK